MEVQNGTRPGLLDDDEIGAGVIADDEESYEDFEFDAFLDTFGEDDDEESGAYDDDEILGAVLGAAVPGLIGTGVRAVSNLIRGGAGRKKVTTRAPHQYSQYVRGKSPTAYIPTRSGAIRARIPGNYVTSDELKKALAVVRADMARMKTEIKTVDANARKAEAKLRADVTQSIAANDRATKKSLKRQERNLKAAEARLNKKLAGTRDTMMMMTLLNRPPEIQQLTLSTGVNAGDTVLPVASTNYRQGNNSLLPLLLIMGDGLGGGGSSGDSSNLLLVLALSGAL